MFKWQVIELTGGHVSVAEEIIPSIAGITGGPKVDFNEMP